MNPSNQIYTLTLSGPPVWIPESQETQNLVRVLLYLHELADRGLSVAVDERRVVRPTAPLRVAPRPCRGVLQVGLPPGVGTRDLRIHDACGRLVAQRTVAAGGQRAVLDLHHLQPGVYYVSTAGAGTAPVVVVR